MIRWVAKIVAAVILFSAIAGVSAYFTLTRLIKGEDTVVVPNLVGRDAVYALQLLTDLELNTKVKGSEYSANVSRNHIIFQDPGPGEIIKKGRDIRLIISKGAQTVSVPNLEGLDLQQVQLILEENGIVEGAVSKTYSVVMKEGSIITQYPPAGTEVNRGAPTDLLISIGRRPMEYQMPDLRNLSLNCAVGVIEKNRLGIGTIKPIHYPARPLNLIVGQDPPFGYHVKSGQRINLEVNQAPVVDAGGNRHGLNGGHLFRYRIPPGFLKQHIRIELRISEFSSTIYDQLMRPGKEIWVLVPGQTESAIFLYKNDQLIDTRIFGRFT